MNTATSPALIGPAPDATELRKAVQAIHMSGNLSLAERKLINILLLNAIDDLNAKPIHSIPLAVLLGALGWWDEESNRRELRDALDTLVTTKVTFDLFNPSGTPSPNWGTTSFLAGVVVEDGMCHYEYSATLRGLLAEPESYSIINLRIQEGIGSAYALALYENCHRYVNVKTTGAHSVEQWRKALGATAPLYDEFKRFNERVISKAVRDVNDSTDILVTPYFTRKNRRVTDIGFTVERKRQEDLFPTKLAIDHDDDDLVASDLYRRGIELGIGKKKLLEMLRLDAYRAEKAICATEQRVRTAEVKNAGGYALRLFQDGTFIAPYQEKDEQARQAQAALDAAAAAEQAKKDARGDRIRAAIKALSAEQRRAYAAQFLATPEGQGAKFNAATGKMDAAHLGVFQAFLAKHVAAE